MQPRVQSAHRSRCTQSCTGTHLAVAVALTSLGPRRAKRFFIHTGRVGAGVGLAADSSEQQAVDDVAAEHEHAKYQRSEPKRLLPRDPRPAAVLR